MAFNYSMKQLPQRCSQFKDITHSEENTSQTKKTTHNLNEWKKSVSKNQSQLQG